MTDPPFFSIPTALGASPARGQMRAANFRGFTEFVRNRDASPQRVFEFFGLSPTSAHSEEQHIDMQAFVDIFEYCAEMFGDRLFGLRFAENQGADVFGCVTTLCRSAPDFRTAIERFIEFIPVVHSPVTRLELLEGKDVSEFRFDSDTHYGMCDQSLYQSVMLNLKLFEEIAGKNFQPSYVSLNVDADVKDIDEIERKIGCRFYPSEINAVAFPTSYLTMSAVHANRLVFDLLSGYLSRVKSAARTSLAERVEDYIRSSLSSGVCSISRCAKRLGIPERTLQLHLADRKLSFSSLLETERMNLSKRYLEREHLSLDDVAVMLGYSEQSSFGRAFKRWTGVTPQRYREFCQGQLN